MLQLEHLERLSNEDDMPDEIEMDRRSAGMQIHRDLGRLEGRVSALETAMNKIEAALGTIFSKLNEIQQDIATSKGKENGQSKTIGIVGAISNALFAAIVAIVAAFIVVHFGK